MFYEKRAIIDIQNFIAHTFVYSLKVKYTFT